MPSLIQRQPAGLLSLLQATSDGNAPNQLLDEVRGVVDLTAHYGLARRDGRVLAITGASIVAGGVGFYPASATDAVMAPAGQAYLVHYFGAYVTPANPTTGTNFRFSVGYQSARDTTVWTPHGNVSVAPPSGGIASAGGAMPRPFLQTPQDIPTLYVEAGSGSAGNMRLCLIFDRIRY